MTTRSPFACLAAIALTGGIGRAETVIEGRVELPKRASKKSHAGWKTAVPAVQANSRPRLFGQAVGLSALTGEDASLPCQPTF